MAKPQRSYPNTATNGARKRATSERGRAALEEALAEQGEDLATFVEMTDDFDDVLTTAILVLASADEDELAYVTDSVANLVETGENLSTEETTELAAAVGESADELADALDTVLELQREGHLEDLIELAKTLSALDVDVATVGSLNDLLDAVGEANREPTPDGVVGTLRRLVSRDVLAGVGYLVTVLGALGRRVRDQ